MGGDNWSCDVISHWNAESFKNVGFFTIRDLLHKEAEGFKAQIDRFRQACPNAQFIYILGNHEDWINQLEAKYPSFSQREGLSIKTLLDIEKRFYRVVPFGGVLTVGKLSFMHGHQFGTQNPAKQAVDRTMKTCVFGHHHTYKVWAAFSEIDDNEKVLGIQVPCFTKTAPEYARGRPNQWLNGFFQASVKKSGNFTHHVTLVSPKGHFLIGDKEFK